MRRFWAWTVALSAALAAAMAATLAVRGLGFSPWHYHVALAVAVAATLVAWPWLGRRRVATLAMAWTGLAATVTGFAMLYTKQFPYKEWLTWWHCATSFAFLGAFLAHWANNNPRLVDLTRRLFRARAAPGAAVAAWTGALALGAWTASPQGGAWITGDTYLAVSGWTIVAGVAFAYGAWWLYRVPALRARLEDSAHRGRARGAVDGSLFLANWAMLLTGFALLWLAEPLRAGPLKYPSKWWHTAASVAFLALLAIHLGFNARLLAAHARRVDEELGR